MPLVSGTAESDVAGSLTYYFNAQQQLQRITFAATRAIPRAYPPAAGRYQLTWRPTNDPALVVYEAVRSDSRPARPAAITYRPGRQRGRAAAAIRVAACAGAAGGVGACRDRVGYALA